MKYKIKILTTGLLLSSALLYCCQKDNAGADLSNTDQVKIYLPNHQTRVFNGASNNIQQLELKLTDNRSSGNAWITLNIRSGVYNILRFRKGSDILFANRDLPDPTINDLRLNLCTQISGEKNSTTYCLRFPDPKPHGTVSKSI